VNVIDFVTAAAHAGAGGRSGPLPVLDSPELWPKVLELAIDHRVAPLLAEALAHDRGAVVPAEVSKQLEAQCFRSSATRLLCESALADVLTLLRARGVEVLVLKGATVAHTAYARPELRLYHDIDVLCRVDDYPALHAGLIERGYTSAGTLEARGTHEQLAHKPSPEESHSVRGFYDPSGDMKIEVHFDALQLGLRDRQREEFWRQSRRLELNGVELCYLGPEHQFLHLATHAHRHGYSRLSWLIELDILVQRGFDSMDWQGLAELARAEGVGAMLRHALATSHAILGTVLPKLPPPNLEERCLSAAYRSLWPFSKTRALNQHERHRLLHFLPDDADPRNVLYGLVLVGRRRDKLRAMLRRHLA
jgi:hypothetical protein